MKRVADEINADVMLVNLPGLCRTKPADSNEVELVVERTRVTRENFPLWAELKDFETELFQEIGFEHGMRVIDVHREFERFSGALRLELFTDEMHMTAYGTYETAAAVARALRQASAAVSRP